MELLASGGFVVKLGTCREDVVVVLVKLLFIQAEKKPFGIKSKQLFTQM